MSNLTLKDFEVSEFNVLRGNVSDSRESRDKTIVNTDEGLSTDTGVLSQAQDSNYSLESWTRGRYTGTEQTYLIGNNPSLSLTPLKIAVFEKETQDKTIGDLLRSTPRNPEFEEGYFVTYVRESKLSPVPTPSFGTLVAQPSGDTITVPASNNNTTGKPVTTEFRVSNGEWFTFVGGTNNVSLAPSLTVNIGNLPPDTEITFQIRNKMRSRGFETFSRTVTRSQKTARKPVTATFVHFQDKINSLQGLSPFSIGFDEPIRFGFDFKGWEPSLPRTIIEDTTFIAQWEKLPEEFSDPVTPQFDSTVFLTGLQTTAALACGSSTGTQAKSTQPFPNLFLGSTKIRRTDDTLFTAGLYGISASSGTSASTVIQLDSTGRVVAIQQCT